MEYCEEGFYVTRMICIREQESRLLIQRRYLLKLYTDIFNLCKLPRHQFSIQSAFLGSVSKIQFKYIILFILNVPFQ